ncbi:forkhead box protein N3-like [Argiope bruennichi]|uniref:Forkhead box protein N3 n=1 Tax=Argiope bruennichi TaxID=94029 RepID=A0A8T0FR15_ARGBR|nr:forkhead box protein N3-like [Argiope bruennichi]XP_055931469.1 forkhead box protein N3-like [Argiope bruennichi]KAF8793607.1 Forkhead box protein N3 like protein [Argiope bruennichi]
MAVEEHSDEEKAIFAMTTNFKHGQNGSLAVRTTSSSPTVFFTANPEKESTGVDDDELTSLAWLQDTNLLKNFQMGSYGIEGEEVLSDSPSSDYLDETAEHVTVAGDEGEQNVEPLPAHSPYNPTLHANSKPPFSFSCLIFMAIEDSINKALPVKDIYNWILTHFPYFQNAPTGWKNSVRHNLSLSKCFRKVEKEKGQNVGKGSLWCIDPEFRPNLLQALQKAPSMANLEFSHFSYLSPAYCQNGRTESEVKPCLLVSSQEAIQIPSPELFPFLSRRLASSMKDPEVDAAATMLTLKNGPNLSLHNMSDESENDSIQCSQWFPRKRLRLKPTSHGAKKPKVKPIIITSPSEDHTYSASLDLPVSSPKACNTVNKDEVHWSNEKSTHEGNISANGNHAPKSISVLRKNAEEEGAHALMNLAEIASKRLLKKTNSKTS